MTMLVTGATGFVGTNVVREAAAAGLRVRAAGHRRASPHLDGLGVEVVRGDITRPDQADALVRGCDVVLHVAGDASSYWRRLAARQHRINVEGTMNIARACVHHEVSRLVYTSTIDVLGHDPSRAEINEDTGVFNLHQHGLLLRGVEVRSRVPAAPLRRPARPRRGDHLPRHDARPVQRHQPVGRAAAGAAGRVVARRTLRRVVVLPRHRGRPRPLAAVDKGQRGHGYICGGHNMRYRDCLNLMADAIGAAHPRPTLPEMAMVTLGRAEELRAAVTGQPPTVDPGMAHYLSKYQYVDSTKAIDRLGYVIPDVDTILTDTVDWYRSQGHDL